MAWHGLGWTPVAFSEIEKFPKAVLAHHYPNVPDFGDMTKFKDWPDETIDLLVGGTPCQSFSVAGLREGLDDPRGNLALTYLAIAERYRPRWLVWENVPGVLSIDGGRAFGSIIGGMVKLGYCPSWRVLDAQYVRTFEFPGAVPQRRRRVFVVGYLGDWRRSAAVLFDSESLQGNPAPSRQKGQAVAGSLTARFGRNGGAANGDVEANRLVVGPGGEDVSHAVSARDHKGPCSNLAQGTLVAFDYKAIIPSHDVAQPLLAKSNSSHRADAESYIAQPIAFDCKGTEVQYSEVVNPPLRSMGHSNSKSNAGGHAAIAFVQNTRDEVRLMGGDGQIAGALAAQKGMKQQTYLAEALAFQERGRKGGPKLEIGGDVAYSLTAPSGGGRSQERTILTPRRRVRRLTPVECERLQGYPDGYTLIPLKSHRFINTSSPAQCNRGHYRIRYVERCKFAADGPRYKSLGNSMAINVMKLLGHRIQMVEKL